MGYKIFVSYKYADSSVASLGAYSYSYPTTTARNYVDKFETGIKNRSDSIYKGESDGEDLSYLSENSIWKKTKR